jgi:copper transport protein
VWMSRSVFALLLALVALALPASGSGGAAWWGAAALGAGMLATFSLGGHAVEVSGQAGLAALLDWLHALAAMVWLGGLVALALALRVVRGRTEARGLVAPLAKRFSSVALVCVAYLGVSGLYGYSRQVAGFGPLIDTAYGRVLIVKLCLFGVLVLLGALNRFFLLPGLADPSDSGADRATRRFGRSLGVEMAVGALVLLTVGALTSLGPAAEAYASQQRMGPSQTAGVGRVGLVLRLAPGQIGDNFLAVDVADHRTGADLVPGTITVRLVGSPDKTTMPPSLRKGGLERYQADGYPLPRAGRLAFAVTLTRLGFNPVEHVFTLDVGTK